MLPRQFETVKMGPTDLTWFYPHEIIKRLESMAYDCGIDLKTAPRDALAPGEQLDALDTLVNSFFLPTIKAKTEPLAAGYARLSTTLQHHLTYLLHSSRKVAIALQSTQPNTPLGVPKGPQGVLSNLLSASWIDLTEGGKREVTFVPCD